MRWKHIPWISQKTKQPKNKIEFWSNEEDIQISQIYLSYNHATNSEHNHKQI